MSDKPAFTTLAHLAEARRAQDETGRIRSVCFSERFENAATARASPELITAIYHSARARAPVRLPLATDHRLDGGWQLRGRA
jgi:hypothetical protein